MKDACITKINIDEVLIKSEIIKLADKNIVFFVLHRSKIVYTNYFFEISMGYTKDELNNIDIEDIFDEDSRKVFEKHKKNNKQKYNIRIHKKNGQKVWINAYIKDLELEEKELIMVIGCEITESIKIKEKLKIKQQFYEILNNDMELIISTTIDHRYTFINDAYCNYFGVKREKLIGKSDFSYVLEEDKKKIIQELKSVTIDKPFIKLEVRALKKDGSLVWGEWIGYILYNEFKEPIKYIAIGRDITKRKGFEEELKKIKDILEVETEKRTHELNEINKKLMSTDSQMKSILMSVSECVAVIDDLGNFENLNTVLEKKWNVYLKDIKKFLKNMILKEKDNCIYKMLKKKKSFYENKLIIPAIKGKLQLFISGNYIDSYEENINKGIIVLRNIKEINEIGNNIDNSQAKFTFSNIITKNKKMMKIIELGYKASLGEANILIQGESGTGKELFAQSIHNNSKRCTGPFIAVNCGAISRELIGSELFGYTEGSFTGARKGGKRGKFELASGGTIFLDEIGDMPFEQQVSLLRVIQEKKVMRIGGERETPIDVRIICATNKNLYESMKDGSFRQDLYYRLNVISIKIPPLRERCEDIPILFEYFIKQISKNGEKILKNIDPLAMEYLKRYNWHGNIRELQNIVERIICTTNNDYITLTHLVENIFKFDLNSIDESEGSLKEICIKNILETERSRKEDEEIDEIIKLLKEYKGNISKIARKMDISRSTLYRKMDKYKIEKQE